jgi:uncharacterized membrane protein
LHADISVPWASEVLSVISINFDYKILNNQVNCFQVCRKRTVIFVLSSELTVCLGFFLLGFVSCSEVSRIIEDTEEGSRLQAVCRLAVAVLMKNG